MAGEPKVGEFTEDHGFISADKGRISHGEIFLRIGREREAKSHGWQPVMLCHGDMFIARKDAV